MTAPSKVLAPHPMTNFTTQLQTALDSLLENEALTSELDDESANALLAWGMAHVRNLHRQAADQPDPEGFLDAQMKTTRKWMRRVNQWTASRAEKDEAEHLSALSEILAQAGVHAAPDQQTEFLRVNLTLPAPEFIAHLRAFCENS